MQKIIIDGGKTKAPPPRIRTRSKELIKQGFPLWVKVLFRGLIPDIKMGAGIFFKGKFGLLPERVKRMEEVKKLYEEAAREQ